jgi:hypothetical protein
MKRKCNIRQPGMLFFRVPIDCEKWRKHKELKEI